MAAGREVSVARKRRRLTQEALAERIGLSRARLAAIEAGQGDGAPLDVWFAIARALGRYLKFEFARDPQSELVDAGHLAIQELVITVAKAAGWEVHFEAPSGSWDSRRSIDVRLTHRHLRRIVIVECWNTFGDLGAATRSSNEKVRNEEQRAVAIAGDGQPFIVGLEWVVRATKVNRELIAKYPGIFETRLGGSSAAWGQVLTQATAAVPEKPGLVWCDVNATRLYARRRNTRA